MGQADSFAPSVSAAHFGPLHEVRAGMLLRQIELLCIAVNRSSMVVVLQKGVAMV